MALSRWADGFPLVTVPQGTAEKRVTFVYPYYCNPQFLRQQVSWWNTYPDWLRCHLSAVIVDDGSPGDPAADVLRALSLPFPIRVFRIEQDVRWNWIAARNIGMHHAADGWCVLTDIDHVIPQSTAGAMVYGKHDPAVTYGFSRIEHTGDPLSPHMNSWFMTRERFWAIGGYDEAFSGRYGSDGDWRRRIAEAGPLHILRDRLVRHEHVGDSSTTQFKRKDPADVAAVKAILAARTDTWRPKTLSFAYHEATP